jgi:hypothetical protein
VLLGQPALVQEGPNNLAKIVWRRPISLNLRRFFRPVSLIVVSYSLWSTYIKMTCPLLLSIGFLVMSGLCGFRLVRGAREAGQFGTPFVIGKARRSAFISGLYMMLAVASLAIVGFVPDSGVDSLSAIVCLGLPSVPLGIYVALANYWRAKKTFEYAQQWSWSKELGAHS